MIEKEYSNAFGLQYSKFYDAFNSTKPYKKEIKFVYKWADKPHWIFDIGCGTCNYWKYYPKSVVVVGVDKSKNMTEKMPVGVIHADIAEYKHSGRFDLVTALFDVVQYIPKHDWWHNLPLNRGGLFIFDMWDKDKVHAEGFRTTFKMKNKLSRTIIPMDRSEDYVHFKIEIVDDKLKTTEDHVMYLWSREDIERFCGNAFEIVEVKPTKTWQIWYKLRRK